MPNEEVIDVKPEEGVNVNVENGVDMSTPETPVVTPKTGNVKKGLLIGGLVLTGLAAGYGIYVGVKWARKKIASKKSAKAEAETQAETTTEAK